MRAGQLEVMVNRRTAMSDELGNPEKMDEMEGKRGASSLFVSGAFWCLVCAPCRLPGCRGRLHAVV